MDAQSAPCKRGYQQQGAQKLGALTDIQLQFQRTGLFHRRTAADADRQTHFFFHIGDSRSRRFQQLKQRPHRAPLHLFRCLHRVHAIGKSEHRSQKTGRGPRASHINFTRLFGYHAGTAADHNLFSVLPDLHREAEILQGAQKMSGVF